jgi:hypothetical protein
MLYALFVISPIIWLAMRDAKDTLLMPLPIALASFVTAALTVAVGRPFNYGNMIALPWLMGIDSGIQIVAG